MKCVKEKLLPILYGKAGATQRVVTGTLTTGKLDAERLRQTLCKILKKFRRHQRSLDLGNYCSDFNLERGLPPTSKKPLEIDFSLNRNPRNLYKHLGSKTSWENDALSALRHGQKGGGYYKVINSRSTVELYEFSYCLEHALRAGVKLRGFDMVFIDQLPHKGMIYRHLRDKNIANL